MRHRPVAAAHDPQRLAGVVAVEPQPLVGGHRPEPRPRPAPGSPSTRCSPATLAVTVAGPQCQVPTSSSSAGSPPADHASTGAGSWRASPSSSSSMTERVAVDAVVLVNSTTPSPAAAPTGPDAVPPLPLPPSAERPPAHRHPDEPAGRRGSRASTRRARRTARRRRSTPGSPARGPPPTAARGRRRRGAARPSRRACRPTAASAVAAAEEGRPAGQVGDRGPQLPGGGHRPGVVLGLGQQQVGERVHGEPEGRRPRGPRRRAGHPQRLEQLVAHDLEPAATVGHLEQPAQRGVADVGVVEPATGAEPLPDRRGDEGVPVAAGRALPPRPRRLGLGAGGVGEQLLDGDVVEGGPRHVRAEPVGELEPAGVAQPQHAHRDEGLGDRAHPVLRVGIRPPSVGAPVDRAGGTAPDELAAAHQPGGDRGSRPSR